MIARGGRRAGVGHERRHRFTAWMGVLVLVPALLCACHRTSPPPVRLTFAPSGLDGGGFVNVVAYDPSGSGVVLAGGDVSGIQRSTDFGRSWAPANTGIAGLAQLKIASLLFSPRVAGEVYAAVGDEGRGGGLLVSTDDGRSWALRSDVPNFSGGNNVGTPLPPRHPRSTGTLLAADPTRDILYAATFHDGVMRSDDDGRSWTTLGLAGSYLRGLALDSGHPDVLYAAAFDDAVYRTAAASSTGTMARLDASPRDAEELAIVGNGLYAAAGRQGLLASSDGGSTGDRCSGPISRTARTGRRSPATRPALADPVCGSCRRRDGFDRAIHRRRLDVDLARRRPVGDPCRRGWPRRAAVVAGISARVPAGRIDLHDLPDRR